jgi:hypothetical protein
VASPWQADVLQPSLSLLYAFQRTHQQLIELSSEDANSDKMTLDCGSLSNITVSVGGSHNADYSVDTFVVI